MPVTDIYRLQDFKSHISENLSIVCFTPGHTNSCFWIRIYFEFLSYDYQGIKFFQVNVDYNPDISDECGIDITPTFQVFLEGSKIDQLVGDALQLRAFIKKHA